jgi:pyruvate kinase
MTPAFSAPVPLVSEARTKIVATVGPACRKEDQLTELTIAGVDVFRLNMAHAGPKEQDQVVASIRKVSKNLGRAIGILVDLAGPKIRLGEIAGGQRELREGESVRFVRGEIAKNAEDFVTTYDPLIDDLEVGNRVMLVDGTIGLRVEEKTADYARCIVTQGGLVRSRQGVNLPGVKLSVAAMSDEDWQNAAWAADSAIDFISLSFVRTPTEVRGLKEFLAARGSHAKVVAKIEKQEALDQLEAIVDATDAVMVARGDLGVETDVAMMPIVQKRIVAMCRLYQKPVIVATQMLDSMQRETHPTRAEATDVANAILDGADACMLSGETAIGQHPRLAVEMMNRIARATEAHYVGNMGREIAELRGGLADSAHPTRTAGVVPDKLADGLLPITQAVVHGAARIAGDLSAKAIVVISHTGATALALCKLRGPTPILGVSDSEITLRQMCLYWGVLPLPLPLDGNVAETIGQVTHWGLKEGRCVTGDRLVFVAGSGLPIGVSGHNLALVHEVQ